MRLLSDPFHYFMQKRREKRRKRSLDYAPSSRRKRRRYNYDVAELRALPRSHGPRYLKKINDKTEKGRNQDQNTTLSSIKYEIVRWGRRDGQTQYTCSYSFFRTNGKGLSKRGWKGGGDGIDFSYSYKAAEPKKGRNQDDAIKCQERRGGEKGKKEPSLKTKLQGVLRAKKREIGNFNRSLPLRERGLGIFCHSLVRPKGGRQKGKRKEKRTLQRKL